MPAQTIGLCPARPSATRVCRPSLPSNNRTPNPPGQEVSWQLSPTVVDLHLPSWSCRGQLALSCSDIPSPCCSDQARRMAMAEGKARPAGSPAPAALRLHCQARTATTAGASKTNQQNQGLSCRSCSQLSAESRLRLPARSSHPHAERQPGMSPAARTAPAAPPAVLGLTLALSGGSCSRGAAELGSRGATQG